MRTIALLLAAVGVVSAGTIFKWNGENQYVLDTTNQESIKLKAWQSWDDIPELHPPGNFTNTTLINEPILKKDEESIVKIKLTHALDVGYKGQYLSTPEDGLVWNFNYLLNAYGKIIETVTFDVAGWYQFKTTFTINLFDIDMLKQELLFSHPWMILQEKLNTQVSLPFDLKLRSSFKVNDLLTVNIKLTDRLRANFNKELDGVAQEILNFIGTAFKGEVYEEPADDTINIANAANYFPNSADFVYGGQVLTNHHKDALGNPVQHQNYYKYPLAKWAIGYILGNNNWSWSTVTPINFWVFDTGYYTN